MSFVAALTWRSDAFPVNTRFSSYTPQSAVSFSPYTPQSANDLLVRRRDDLGIEIGLMLWRIT